MFSSMDERTIAFYDRQAAATASRHRSLDTGPWRARFLAAFARGSQVLDVGCGGGRDLALITRQLATLVRAALPLEEALQAVAQQTDRPAAQRILTGVRARVMEGDTLATALGGFPRVFPEIYRATVGAGEQSGRLDTVLERLADYTERRDQLRQRVLGALLYPIVLTAMCVVVVAGLLTYVVPQVVAVFESGGNSLPWLTRALLAVARTFTAK